MRVHNSTVGHGGFNRTLRNLKKIGKVWEGMRHDIRAYIKQCPCCQKMSADKQKPVTHRFTTSTYAPMECINIDFIGPFPDKGYILVMVDTFTRFVELSATTDNTAKSAVTGLIEHVGRYGAPKFLRSDNGPHFVNKILEEFVKVAGSTHNLILPYSSQENSIVERMNKEINRHITAFTFDRATTENYREILPFVQRIVNTTFNVRTQSTAAKLIYGNAIDLDANILLPRDEINLDMDNVTHSTEKIMQMQDELIRITANLLKEADEKRKAGGSTDYTTFEIDSLVLVTHRTSKPTRMHTLWKGPMQVVANDLDEYTLLDLITNREKRYHVSNIKQFEFDPTKVNPTDIARRDYLEFFIEDILAMEGNIRVVGTLKFHVKWLNYPHDRNTWEPWKNMRDAEKVHEFLIAKNLKHLIPSKFAANYR